MKISWITAKVFLSGNLLKRVKWNEEETSIDGDTPIAIQPKFKNRTRSQFSRYSVPALFFLFVIRPPLECQ